MMRPLEMRMIVMMKTHLLLISACTMMLCSNLLYFLSRTFVRIVIMYMMTDDCQASSQSVISAVNKCRKLLRQNHRQWHC